MFTAGEVIKFYTTKTGKTIHNTGWFSHRTMCGLPVESLVEISNYENPSQYRQCLSCRNANRSV